MISGAQVLNDNCPLQHYLIAVSFQVHGSQVDLRFPKRLVGESTEQCGENEEKLAVGRVAFSFGRK
jgi:hypothetical protein